MTIIAWLAIGVTGQLPYGYEVSLCTNQSISAGVDALEHLENIEIGYTNCYKIFHTLKNVEFVYRGNLVL